MDFSLSPRAADLRDRVRAFVADEIEPIEAEAHQRITRLRESGGDSWTPDPVIGELQAKARAQGLWNLFLPAAHAGRYAADFGTDGGEGLTNVDYAPVAEAMGRSFLAPLVFNSNAPDTGNMEVLLRYGTDEQREQWLEPLLRGEIRSAFCMTEPAVASSDATNMAATAEVDGDEIVINGRKWWSTGVGNPDCKVLVFMGLSDPEADRHSRHTMVLVPRDAAGVKVERMLTTMGYYDEPLGHGEVSFDNVRVPASNVLLGPGRAFEIAQGRLGPGRVHHCMRAIGLAERALELACARARLAHRLRQADRQPRRQPRAHRRRPHRDQPLAPAGHARRVAARPGHEPRGLLRGERDQGGGAQHGPRRHRHGDPAARRWRA